MKLGAGWTKFREMRTQCFAASGNAGRWMCEVSVPSRRGCKLWLGTFDDVEDAVRGRRHRPPCSLSPVSYASLVEVRRAVIDAVEDF